MSTSMKNTNGIETKRFYDAIRRFLTEDWGKNCAGPWWEGGLQVDFGSSLKSLGTDLVDPDPPSYLKAWPGPIMARRLAALEHRSRTDKTAGHRGIFLDFQFLKILRYCLSHSFISRGSARSIRA